MLPIFFHILNQANREENRQLILYRRQLRDNSNPFALPEKRFIELFRLSKDTTRFVIRTISPHLQAPSRRTGISVEIKILVALRYYASGEYQRSVGEDFNFGLSQTAIHRCIHQTTTAICNHMAVVHIQFPQTFAERNRIRVHFMNRFHFPGVIGAIDGTHIAIVRPREEEHNFLNRKGFHSLNVQIICNSQLKIMNVNANFGGSTHDAFIWRHSAIRVFMEQLYENGEGCFLLGDSGYPLQPYLLTPVPNAAPNTPQANYNTAHASARNTVERTIGLLKMRFRCILKERTARYKPRVVADLVTACAVLHNLCIERDIPVYNEADVQENNDAAENVNIGDNRLHNLGRQARDNIINQYFQ